MAEPDDDVRRPDELGSKLGEALESFKERSARADTKGVSDTSARARMNWDPVTGTDDPAGPERETSESRSSFQFDLGGALARLGDSAIPTATPSDYVESPGTPASGSPPLPTRSTSATAPPAGEAPPLPTRAPTSQGLPSGAEAPPLPTRSPGAAAPQSPAPEAPPLPTRSRSEGTDRLPPRTVAPASTPAQAPEAPAPATPPISRFESARQAAARRSVFDDAAPAPQLPSTPHLSTPAPSVPAPSVPAQPPAGTPGMPVLPMSAPARPPAVVAPIETGPSTPDINALRSAQLRASRNQRRGKLFSRSLLAFILIGGLVAAALIFGRSYLFTTEWDAQLTPIVDEVQLDRGSEFDHAIALVERPAGEYGKVVTEAVLGADWITRLPEWRALGVAGGDGAPADVEMRFAAMYPAVYDAGADRIFVSAEADADGVAPALRLAVEAAFAAQTTGDAPAAGSLGLTGPDNLPSITRRAVDAELAGLSGAAPASVADLAGLPLPVAYELRAIDSFGSALLAGADGVRIGDPVPDLADSLSDDPSEAISGLRQPGDQQVLAPVALGADDWALIWGARLPVSTAAALAGSFTADSYSVVNRSGVTCFIAVFQMPSEVRAASLTTNLTNWVNAAPPASQASVAQLGASRVQLEACDPGPESNVAPDVAAAVDALIDRQLGRLAG